MQLDERLCTRQVPTPCKRRLKGFYQKCVFSFYLPSAPALPVLCWYPPFYFVVPQEEVRSLHLSAGNVLCASHYLLGGFVHVKGKKEYLVQCSFLFVLTHGTHVFCFPLWGRSQRQRPKNMASYLFCSCIVSPVITTMIVCCCARSHCSE